MKWDLEDLKAQHKTYQYTRFEPLMCRHAIPDLIAMCEEALELARTYRNVDLEDGYTDGPASYFLKRWGHDANT